MFNPKRASFHGSSWLLGRPNFQSSLRVLVAPIAGISLFAATPVYAQNQFDEIVAQSIDIDPEPPGFSSPASQYGSSVALHQNRLVMGGTGSPIIVFQEADGVWDRIQVLSLPDGQSLATSSSPVVLATYENFLLIGDAFGRPIDSSTRTGLVYIAEWDGSNYTIVSTIAPEDLGEEAFFGEGISINSDYLFVGAPGTDNNEGRIFGYAIPDQFPEIALQSPDVSLSPPANSSGGFGGTLDSSDSWLVTKYRTSSGGSPVEASAYLTSPPAFQSPVTVDLDDGNFYFTGLEVHVRDDVVLFAQKKQSAGSGQRSDFVQFKLDTDGYLQLPTLIDNDPDRGFLPILAEFEDTIHLVSVQDDYAFGGAAPKLHTAEWSGSDWTLLPGSSDAPEDLLTIEDIPSISSAAANLSVLMFGNPSFRPAGSEGGGIKIVSLGFPAEIVQTVDAGRDGTGRNLAASLVTTSTSLIVGAPGWCKVYVLDLTPPDFQLKQTLTAEPPCYFGADILAIDDVLYVGNPAWEPSDGSSRPLEGQVHVFTLANGTYVEQDPVRVTPHIALRQLGSKLAGDSGGLFIAGSSEVFKFEKPVVSGAPDAVGAFDNVVAQTDMDLSAKSGVVAVTVSGRLGGAITIFDSELAIEGSFSDSASDFGVGVEVLGPMKIVTTRQRSMAEFEFSGGNWSLASSIAPDPEIKQFGSSIVQGSDQILFGTGQGFVTAASDDGAVELDIYVPVVESDFPSAAKSLAWARDQDQYSAFIGFPDRVVSQSKRDLLLHVEYEAVIRRDGFEGVEP